MSKHTHEGKALTPEVIAATALDLADEIGIERLTVRGLAKHLNIGTMTFYGYFRSKDEILDAMANLAMGSLTLPEPAAEPENPRDAIRVVATEFHALLRRHPAVAQVLNSRVTDSHRARRGAMENLIDRLVSSGIPGPLAIQCYGFIMVHVLGFVGYQAPRPWARSDDPANAELRRQQIHHFAALPLDEFPRLVSLREHVIDLPSDAQFDFGIDCLSTMVEQVLHNDSSLAAQDNDS